MKTLQSACAELGVTYRTLEKWMRRLDITPATHPRDFRYRVLQDDQVELIKTARAEMPQSLPARASATRRYDQAPRRVLSPTPLTQQSDSLLSASLVQLPDDLVTLESFCLVHGIAKQTAVKGMTSGRLPVIEGNWKVHRAYARWALDAQGRRIFIQLWSTRPTFHRCEACPHT